MDRYMITDSFLFGSDGGAGDIAGTSDKFLFGADNGAGEFIDDFGVEKGEAEAALLLPAVQSAREATRSSTCKDGMEPGDVFAAETDWTAFTLVELLVV